MSDTKRAFADDCFGRKEFANNLFKLIKNQKDYESRVIAIKADFGLGKTFFAKELKYLMEEYLEYSQNEMKIYPHYINIWKEDYTNEPLLALLYALKKIADKYQNLWDKNIMQEVVKHGIAAGQVLCESFYPFGSIISRMIDKFDEIEKGNIFVNETKMENFINSISKAFSDMENKKVVIIIDEIDRCIPEYAIRFLETLKHFFDVRGLYFILMFNENHLKKSIKKQFHCINFTLWKDKFIDLEFDLSVFHNQENFIKYLVEQKYKFGGKNIDNMQMYITYKITEPRKQDIIRDAKNLFGTNWTSYINKFLNSLNIKLNNRQLNMLCFRLNLALDIMSYETTMPDCLMCVILKDMFKDKKPDKKDDYNEIPFTYFNNVENKHIISLFYDGKAVVSPVSESMFLYGNKVRETNEITIETQENKGYHFDINKKAAEFAILVATQ